jgi:CrcB protein
MNQTLTSFLLVALGGSVGACSRYALSLALRNQSINLPVGTILANLIGCLIIGVVAGLELRMPGISPEVRLLLASGFCGGLTTMSSFIYETSKITGSGEYAISALYIALTLAGSYLCFSIGFYTIKLITRAL